jgi:hypothetical protein
MSMRDKKRSFYGLSYSLFLRYMLLCKPSDLKSHAVVSLYYCISAVRMLFDERRRMPYANKAKVSCVS